jgi:putative endonuclease
MPQQYRPSGIACAQLHHRLRLKLQKAVITKESEIENGDSIAESTQPGHFTVQDAPSNQPQTEFQAAQLTVAKQSNWFVYLIRTAKGVLYTGISTDPLRRLRQHQGQLTGGAKALRGKGPLTLVWQTVAPNRSIASQWEYQLKQLNKQQKELLVQQRWQPDFLRTDKTPCSTEVA